MPGIPRSIADLFRSPLENDQLRFRKIPIKNAAFAMKTPDSRPRFKSATRHYHRYREENRDGWSRWIDGSKQGPNGRGTRRKWMLATLIGLGATGLIVAVVYSIT